MSIVVVTGSRSLVQHPLRLEFKSFFVRAINDLNPHEVHHGGAVGPDSWASQAFEEIQTVHRPKPHPNMTPAQRLFQRNIEMINHAYRTITCSPIMVACWDGKSKGTRHTIDYAKSEGIPIVSVPFELIERLI